MKKSKFYVFCNSFLSGKPKWLYPFVFLAIITKDSIGFIIFICYKIDMMLPKAFPDWETFQRHVEESIIHALLENHQLDWAGLVFDALNISQSYCERKEALLRALTALKYQSLIKQLGIKPAIDKALSYLYSLRWITVD